MLANGDVIGFVSRRPNLDFFHTGLVMLRATTAQLMLRSAAQSRRRVLDEPLARFLAANNVQHVTLLRALEPPAAAAQLEGNRGRIAIVSVVIPRPQRLSIRIPSRTGNLESLDRRVQPRSRKSGQCWSVSFKCIQQKMLQVARDALMRDRWRSHHHGDTID